LAERMGASKTALVTGGGRGIGAAIAAALARCGFDVAIASRESEQEAAQVIRAIREAGREALYLPFDLAAIETHGVLLDRVTDRFGDIDCLVNNAGVTSLARGDMLHLTAESFDRSFAINVRGTFFLTQAVARRMLAQRRGDGASQYRSIVTITSANAVIAGIDRADYCMTKAALSMMSTLYAARLARANVHVFEVRPGIIRTDMTGPAAAKYDELIARGGVPIPRWGEPEDVAGAVATIARGGVPFATGEVINIGGGLHVHRV
jgi:NAD(P)-dependent dehydrogenase (short-subunit alcohol dehydrogenase family)